MRLKFQLFSLWVWLAPAHILPEKQDEPIVLKENKNCAINVMLFKKEYHFAALCLQVTVMSQADKYAVFSILKTDENSSFLISFWTNPMCLDWYVHCESKYIHLTEWMQFDWVISLWIINEFEKCL